MSNYSTFCFYIIIRFFVRIIASTLSYFKGICLRNISKSFNWCFIQIDGVQQLHATIYSVLVMDNATHVYFLECFMCSSLIDIQICHF